MSRKNIDPFFLTMARWTLAILCQCGKSDRHVLPSAKSGRQKARRESLELVSCKQKPSLSSFGLEYVDRCLNSHFTKRREERNLDGRKMSSRWSISDEQNQGKVSQLKNKRNQRIGKKRFKNGQLSEQSRSPPSFSTSNNTNCAKNGLSTMQSENQPAVSYATIEISITPKSRNFNCPIFARGCCPPKSTPKQSSKKVG